MAWTREEYDALKKAAATGRKVVAYKDRRVEYRSLDEMLAILKAMEEELFPGRRIGRVFVSTSTGIRC